MSAPALAVAYLIAFNVIHVTLGLALGAAAALMVLDGLGWWLTSATFDIERPSLVRGDAMRAR